MNLEDLRVFLTVADLEHITHAAQVLGVSQPAVTKTVQRLESETHHTLVTPQGRGIVLTHQGKIVRHFARQIFAIESKLEHVLQEQQPDASRVVEGKPR